MPKAVAKGKKKEAVVKKTPESEQWEIIRAIAFWGLAILLFLPPYFRGLFFQPEQERALIFAAVIFWFAWLWKWLKRDYSFLSHPMDYFILAFPIVYLISAFQAANYGLAVDEVVKTTLYFMIYWLTSRLVRDEKDVTTILHFIYISAIGVALAGLATTTGIIHINDGFKEGRIYSYFQYPNALASYLAAVTFIGLYLWHMAGLPKLDGLTSGTLLKGMPARLNFDNINKYLYATGNFLLFAVLLGTKSQGGLLVFSIIFILFIIGLPKGSKIPVCIHFILTSIPSSIAIWRFLAIVANGRMDLAWLWVFVGMALALVGQALYSFAERKGLLQWIAAHRNAFLTVVTLVILSGSIGTGVYISRHVELLQPLISKIHFSSASLRVYFFQDALKMFKERPFLGWGGGGWQEAYYAYQSFLYNSNQVHGYYFQIMVETGLLGLLTILGIWFSFLAAAHRAYHETKADPVRRLLVWVLTVAAILIGLHAVIDFDLSLSALALLLWTMFGLMRSPLMSPSLQEKDNKDRKKLYLPRNNVLLVSVTIASLAIIIFVGSLAFAGVYARQAGIYLQKQNISQGIGLLQKAAVNNPWNADYHSNLARIYLQTGKMDEGTAEAQKAISLSKYNALRYADLASLYINTKKNEEAVTLAEKALTLAPYQEQWYDFLCRIYFMIGYNELVAGDRNTAKQHLKMATNVSSRIDATIAPLNETEKKLWKEGVPLMTITTTVKLNAGAAQYLLGQWQEAEVNLQAASQNQGEAFLWLAVLRNKQGRSAEAQELLNKTQIPDVSKRYEELCNLQILNS
ncbi:MAG: O-Antigen ligase [Pelotomaculum sp. PtaB.Bin104]|nr:MAG: O-Antigen ligase [Pelotomaculum sp. PtaB.Bin104]